MTPRYGYIRIFFYVNGFKADDGSLKVVPGSHLYRDPKIHGSTDETLQERVVSRKNPS